MTAATPWAIVLAGGEGARLRELTRDAFGYTVPKQFCRFGSERSLLGQTLERARGLCAPDRIVPVVRESHRTWWTEELAGVPGDRIISQPDSRGTAVAILVALLRIVVWDGEATVALLPSDYFVDDERTLATALHSATRHAQERVGQVTLLGVVPERADPDLGWIDFASGDRAEPGYVRRFVEKPGIEEARRLRSRGALWNTFLMAGSVAGFLRLYREHQPDLWAACVRHLLAPMHESQNLTPLYNALVSRDFSRDLLQKAQKDLRVVRVPACGWSDLGTRERVIAWRERQDAPTGRRALEPARARRLVEAIPAF